MIILSAKKGRVCRFNLQDEQKPGIIKFSFPAYADSDGQNNSPRDFSYDSLHVIFDAVGLAFSPSYQLNDTLSDDILMMTFGQSITPATLRGTVLTAVCQDSLGSGVDDPDAGVVKLVNWWEERNLTKKRIPAEIAIDRTATFRVYVADMKLSVEETENRLWKFSLTLLRVPPARTTSNLTTSGIPSPQTEPTSIPPENVTIIRQRGSESLQRFGTVTPSNPAGFNSPNTPLVGPVSGL